ncbi:hypothetical protein DL95DRAFT_30755 [Leptodontidium sp. 2 PMI_412]|nr:hypothetical protein DL95DRAFT_30755 [Leptodontidium sp. 2 PMI_412]
MIDVSACAISDLQGLGKARLGFSQYGHHSCLGTTEETSRSYLSFPTRLQFQYQKQPTNQQSIVLSRSGSAELGLEKPITSQNYFIPVELMPTSSSSPQSYRNATAYLEDFHQQNDNAPDGLSETRVFYTWSGLVGLFSGRRQQKLAIMNTVFHGYLVRVAVATSSTPSIW